MGVHYFPGWGRGPTDYWQYGTMPAHPERLPLLGNFTSDQRTVDKEIAAASKYGVSFFDLLYYDRPRSSSSGHPELYQGYQRFLAGSWPGGGRGLRWMITYSNDVQAPLSDGEWQSCVADWVQAFKHPNYLKIGGRPVFKVLTPHYLLNRQCSVAAPTCSAIVGARDWPTAVPSADCPPSQKALPSSSQSACVACGGCWDVPSVGFRCATKRMSNASCVTARLGGLEAASAAAGLPKPLIGGSNFWPHIPVPAPTGTEYGWAYDFTGTYNMAVPPPLSAQCAGTATPKLNCTGREFPYAVSTSWMDAARSNHSKDAVQYLPNAIASYDPRPWHPNDLGCTFPTRAQWEAELRTVRAQALKEPGFGFPGGPENSTVKALTIYAWNEYGEGGIVSPTRGEGWMKLEAIKSVFGGERVWKSDDESALPPSSASGPPPRVEFEPPVYVGTTGFEDNRAHAGNFKSAANGVLFGDSGGNMAKLGPARDSIFTSYNLGRSWDGSNAALFPLDGRQVFDWGGKMQCIATGMCSSQPLTDLLTPGGIHNVTVIEVAADGKLQKRQVTHLQMPIRLVGFPDAWKYDPKRFGGSMVVHTLASGTVLMTFTVGFADSGSWAGGLRSSLLAARSTDGGRSFHSTAVIANASLFPGKHGNNSAMHGTLTGASEHDVVELPGPDHRLMVVWRMGAGDGCGKEQFNASACLAIGGYMPYFKAYSKNEGASWTVPEPISNVDPPGCARPWLITMGDTVLLSGGRQRFANTTDVSLWASNNDGMDWTRYSLSGWHNMLVQKETYGGLPAKFSEHVNSTRTPRETSSYTSLLRLPGGDGGAIVMYDHIFYADPEKPPANPVTGRNFNNASIFAMRLRLKIDDHVHSTGTTVKGDAPVYLLPASIGAIEAAYDTGLRELKTDDLRGCRITDFGAVPGNRSSDARRNAAAIQAALGICERVTVPAGAYKIAPVTLPSNRVLFLEADSTLVGSDQWRDYGVTRFLPPMGRAQQLRPLISATNASNITIAGENGTIDGNGWFAWPANNWSNAECGLHSHCAPDVFFGSPAQKLRPAHVLTFVRANDVTLSNVTIKNPGFWGVQHFFCNRSTSRHLTILAPRWTREIAGFMPWSVLNYTVEDSYVHVGDDAVCSQIRSAVCRNVLFLI